MKRMKDREVRESKYISYLLRHHPEAGHLQMDSHGYVWTAKLIAAVEKKYSGFDQEELDDIVKNNDKHRFAYDESHLKIRASQGHSIPVDLELKPMVPPAVLFHGTGEKTLDTILKEGLKPMTREYVHLSWDRETALNVGGRHGKPVVLKVNAEKMQQDGYRFYLSANNVWLTDKVPPEYLEVL